jgi:cytochrome c1
VKHGRSQWQTLIERSTWDKSDGIGLMMDYNTTSVSFGHYAIVEASSKINVQDDQWHHVAGTMRQNGSDYVYSILTGFHMAPPKGFKVTDGKYYNPYFEGWNISMPPPLAPNQVTYSDDTKATVDQMAHDVVTFLTWAAEPTMEDRKRIGFGVMLFLIAFAGLLYLSYRRVWADIH